MFSIESDFVVTKAITLEIKKLRPRRNTDLPEVTELVRAKPRLEPGFFRLQNIRFELLALKDFPKPSKASALCFKRVLLTKVRKDSFRGRTRVGGSSMLGK